MSLSPADTYLAKLVQDFITAQEEVNKNNIRMFEAVAVRLDTQRIMIDQLNTLITVQKQMIDLLANQILKQNKR